MTAFVMIVFSLVTRYAGSWGVPYFDFVSDRGSTCTNTLTGYTCEPLTLADVQFYSDVELPADTAVVSGSYRATHDYQLQAVLEIPKGSSAAGLQSLQAEYGGCVAGHPSPLDGRGLGRTCVMANDDAVTRSGEPPSRLWVVGTGVRKDGTLVVDMSVRSR